MTRGYVGIKNLEKIIHKLSNVIRTLEMKTADFDGCSGKTITLKRGGITDFIRSKTKLWRKSWGLEPLKEIKKELTKFI